MDKMNNTSFHQPNENKKQETKSIAIEIQDNTTFDDQNDQIDETSHTTTQINKQRKKFNLIDRPIIPLKQSILNFAKNKNDSKNNKSERMNRCRVIKLLDDDDGSQIYLYKKWYLEKDIKDLKEFCKNVETKLYPFGMKKNRLLWACGDEGATHSFRKVHVKINEWTPECKKIKDALIEDFDVYTNFCLLNHYRNGKDAISPHSDGETFAKNKSVFTLSTGATRKMQLIPLPNYKHKMKKLSFLLEEGDLLYMCGDAQNKCQHGIDIEPDILLPRHSFTLRSVLI